MPFLFTLMSKRAIKSNADVPKKKCSRNEQPLLEQKSFAQLTLPISSGLFGQPTEILHMIIGHLTLEEIFTFSLMSKMAKRVANGFYANLKYEWIDAMFHRLTTDQERARNCHYLLIAIQPTAKKCSYTTITNWFDTVYHKCQNVPMSLLFEALIKSTGNCNASEVIGMLFKRWMQKDIDKYIDNFPLGVDSSQELKDLETRLLDAFGRVVSDSLQLNTKTYLFTLLVRSLVNVSDVYKLLYLFCVPQTGESVDYEYFAMTHPNDTEIDFGNMPTAFALLMNLWKFPIINQYSSRDIFTILEDLTTLPVMWSMGSFVHFILLNPDLCVLSTCIRFEEGYHDDTARAFYYCIRASKSVEILRPLTAQIMEYLPNSSAQKFADEVIHKSRELIDNSDPTNIDLVTALKQVHDRVIDCMETGLEDSRKICRFEF